MSENNKDELSELDIQLELKDRLPYVEIITASLLGLKNVLRSSKISPSKKQEIVKDFLFDIPDSWVNKKFVENINNAKVEKTITKYPKFGMYNLSPEYCKRHNIQTEFKIIEWDYYALKHAIINLLDDLNMLVRKEKIEYATGKNTEFENLEEFEESFLTDVDTDEEYEEDI
jgi:hypothetical protein